MATVRSTRNAVINVTGARGPSFADVARRVGVIAGIAVPPSASDELIMNLLSQGLTDIVAAGSVLPPIEPVKAAAPGNVNIANPGTAVFDGVTLSNDDRLFVPRPADLGDAGVYIFHGSGSALTRAPDFDQTAEVLQGSLVVVLQGETMAGSWELVTADPIVVGTTDQVWRPFNLRDVTRALLQGAGGTALLGWQNSGAGAVKRWLTDKIGELPGSPFDYGALGGVNDDRAAIQKAVDAHGRVLITAVHRVSAKIDLKDDVEIIFAPGAKIVLAPGITDQYVLRGDGLSRVRFVNLNVEGSGSAGLSAVHLSDCDDVEYQGRTKVTKAGAHGIYHLRCSKVRGEIFDVQGNYYYGIEDKSGVDNFYPIVIGSNNGDTGIATSTGGRGMNVWMGTRVHVGFIIGEENTEYGFRWYSEEDDAVPTSGCSLGGAYFRDNVGADFVAYDESLNGELINDNYIGPVLAHRTTTPTQGASMLLHGGDNRADVIRVVHTDEAALGDYGAFYLYYARRWKLAGCSAKNVKTCHIFSNSNDNEIIDFVGDGVASAAGAGGINGQGNRLNGRYTHAGPGTSDVAFVNHSATGENFYAGGSCHGFHTGIYIAGEAVSIRNWKTTGSGFAGLRKSGTDISQQEFIGNSFDSAAPAVLAAVTKSKSDGDRPIVLYIAPTINIAWPRGTKFICNTPTAGEPCEWTATTAVTTANDFVVTAQAGPRTSIGANPAFKGQVAIVGTSVYTAVGVSGTGDWKQTA